MMLNSALNVMLREKPLLKNTEEDPGYPGKEACCF
jgi:hypothetical protein